MNGIFRSLVFAFYLMPSVLLAQVNFQAVFGGTGDDRGNCLVATRDGGFLIGGMTAGYGSGGDDILLIKTDALGGLQWARVYGGTQDEYLRSVRQTADGGYILAGQTLSYTAGNLDALYIRLNASGNIVWSRTVGGTADDRGSDARETPWGDFYISGNTQSAPFSSGMSDGFLGRLSPAGNLRWLRAIGTTRDESLFGFDIAADGNMVATGPSSNIAGGGLYDFQLVKMDSLGNLVWYRLFGNARDEHSRTVSLCQDGGFLINGHANVGSFGNWDHVLVKTDSSGNLQWDRMHGGTNSDNVHSSIATSDGGYAYTAYTLSGSLGNQDMLLVKTDSSGNEEWRKILGGAASDAAPWGGKNLVEVSPGTFAFSSGTASYGAGSFDHYLVVTDSSGAASPCVEGAINLQQGSAAVVQRTPAISIRNMTALQARTVANAAVVPASSILCMQRDTLGGIINSYTNVTNIDSCNGVTVGSAAGFSVGDKVLIIQMKGASINLTNSAAFGTITNYNEAGNYEYATISAITGNTITFSFGLIRNYDPGGIVQLVSVPQFNNPVIASPLTAAPWNGTTGGILAFDASGLVSLGADLDVTGLGFRGGATNPNFYAGCSSTDYFYPQPNGRGAQKGEGISDPGAAFGAGQGSLANGGGGGNHVNSGGAGGGNFGQGGAGGNQWGGCPVIPIGGDPGRALTYSNPLNKIFMGGGAGGGHQNNSCSTPGENGGGMVLIRADSLEGNGFAIRANGNDQSTVGCIDGAGGGGAGGTVLLEVDQFVGNITVEVSGGDGGDITAANHGPGGGGGGGIIWLSAPAVPGGMTSVLNGGAAGVYPGNISHGAGPGGAGSTLLGLNTPESAITVVPSAFSLGNDTLLCMGDTLTLDPGISGGSYLWSTGDSTQTIRVDTSGLYWMELSPGTGCASRDSIVITFIPVPAPDLGADTSLCAGDSLLLTTGVPSPATWLWSTSATTDSLISGPVGLVWVEVRDTSGLCAARDSIVLTSIALPTVNLGSDTSICQGDTLLLNAGNPGSTYLWSGGQMTQSLAADTAGAWSVTVTSPQGCVASDTLNLSINPLPLVNIGPDSSVCPYDSLLLNAGNPGAIYAWSTGSVQPSIYASIAGNYSVTVTDGNSCSAADTMALAQFLPLTVSLGPDTSVCQGSSLSLDAGNPGNQYSWSTGATTQVISVTNSGTVSVTVTDGNSCAYADTVNVGIYSLPSLNIGPDSSVCTGNSVMLDATGPGWTYAWSTGAATPTVSVMNAGTYSVTVTDANGCQAADQMTLNLLPLPVVNLGPDRSICSGENQTLSAGNPGASYAWSTGAVTGSISVSAAGNYSVTVTDPNGCQGTDDILITVNPNPVVNLGPDQNLCDGDQVVLDAGNSGSNYSWSDGSVQQTLNISQSGTYSVTVTDPNGCQGTDRITLTFFPNPVADAGADTTICEGSSVLLSGSSSPQPPNTGYQWSNGQNFSAIQVSQPGVYWVVLTTPVGCTDADTVQVFNEPSPVVQLGNDTLLCPGDSLLLDPGNPGISYLWSTGQVGPQITVTDSGTYQVVGTSARGCTGEDEISILFGESFGYTLGTDTTVCGNEPIELGTAIPNGSYIWSTGATAPVITVEASGLYFVTVNNECFSVTDSVQVNFTGLSGPFAPNAFSPNGDGLNDEFGFLGLNLESYQLSIFDRWGNLIFETQDIGQTWDGHIGGRDAPEGVYVYRVRFRNCLGILTDQGGSITLFR